MATLDTLAEEPDEKFSQDLEEPDHDEIRVGAPTDGTLNETVVEDVSILAEDTDGIKHELPAEEEIEELIAHVDIAVTEPEVETMSDYAETDLDVDGKMITRAFFCFFLFVCSVLFSSSFSSSSSSSFSSPPHVPFLLICIEDSSVEEELDEDSDEIIRRRGYLAFCSTKDVIPISSVVKAPCAKKVQLPFHGLGDKSLETLMHGLKVPLSSLGRAQPALVE